LNNKFDNSVISLAAVFQCAAAISEIAHKGHTDERYLEVLIRSLLDLKPESVAQIYGGVSGLQPGLALLTKELTSSRAALNSELIRYVVGIFYMERKLKKSVTMQGVIAEGIERASHQIEMFPPTHPNVIANLAQLYSDTMSTLSYRVMVQGEEGILRDNANQNKIRTLLLCGIRSALLWRQNGGNRVTLLLRRKQIALRAEAILKQVDLPN
jgi:high frequency lysogenization protein